VQTILDPEKSALQKLVQEGDRNLDPNQAVAWGSESTFQIGDLPPVHGTEAIRTFLDGFFKQGFFTKLEHEIDHVVELPDELSFEAKAIYTLTNGERLSLPYANFITYAREKGALRFKTYRVYIDVAPLLKRANELGAQGR